MNISDRVFMKIEELGMTQKEFSEKTGIAQSTISEWKSKNNSPTSEKIMIISHVLGVTPEWLLSGSDNMGRKGNKTNFLVIDRESEVGSIVNSYNRMSQEHRAMLLGYLTALKDMDKRDKKKTQS